MLLPIVGCVGLHRGRRRRVGHFAVQIFRRVHDVQYDVEMQIVKFTNLRLPRFSKGLSYVVRRSLGTYEQTFYESQFEQKV